VAAATLLTALTMTACSGGNPVNDNTPTKREITVALWSYDIGPEYHALVEGFRATHPDITVNIEDIPPADYATKMTAELAGGSNVDVFGLKNTVDFAKWQQAGHVMDITDLVDKLDYKDKLAGVDSYKIDGVYGALPYRSDLWILYYNKDLFDKAGKDYPKPGMTWQDFADLSCQMTSGEGDSKVYGSYIHKWPLILEGIAAAQSNGDFMSGDYGYMKPMLQMALDLQDKGCIMSYGEMDQSKTTYNTMFQTEKAAMVPMGTWFMSNNVPQKGIDSPLVNWSIATLPQPKAGGKYVTMQGAPTGFSVNSHAQNPEDAKTFIEWCAGPEGAKTIAAKAVWPAYTDDTIMDTLLAVEGMPTDDGAKKALKPDLAKIEAPTDPKAPDVEQLRAQEFSLIMTGSESLDDGIKNLEDQVKSQVLAG
jgi:multiple sugar transport system substrate-binding protein